MLAEKLKSPIKKVSIINSEQLGKTRLNRNAVFDVYCEDATGARFIVDKDIFSIAEISNFTERELYRYEAVMMNKYDQKACIAYAKKEGEAKGLEKGVLQTAGSMLKDGLEPERVARITKLPLKAVKALR